MNFKEFKNRIEAYKTKTLGGLDAQFKLAPELRLRYDANKIKIKNPKRAAVLALFYPNKKNEATFLLTERATYKGAHSAQISFPGGKVDVLDKNLQETALRETFEEVGVTVSKLDIIRELTEVYIPPSNFLVTPYLAYLDKRPTLITNYEVESTIEVLAENLINDSFLATRRIKTSYMNIADVPCFKFNNYIVWGATAMMLSEIKELIKY
ncbi:CoA pyrophosphatase [uncultured Polaribacter sp.]|uniref:NUDIX hydrolase n=1 Tax=uncultured Polaribacter sp. TaxID=174711 RepID=UPI002632CBF1|nr:CoA pyrophosphatase [uncultured Polaribacter sp.]